MKYIKITPISTLFPPLNLEQIRVADYILLKLAHFELNFDFLALFQSPPFQNTEFFFVLRVITL